MTDVAANESQARCSCCGGDYDEAVLARLNARPDVAICEGCVDGLAARRPGLVRATPVLATDDLAASAAFWRTAGFDVSFYGPDFATAHRGRVELHLVAPPPGRDRGAAYLHARGVDRVHAEWKAAGLPVTDVQDEPWQMREFHVVDPGGNRVRIGQNV